jgi:hypothetical protein
MHMAKAIYLRPADDRISDALKAAAEDNLRSGNEYALLVLEQHLRDAGYLDD